MSRLTRDGTAELVSRDQFLRHERGQGNIHFPCSVDHDRDWQPYSVNTYSAIVSDYHKKRQTRLDIARTRLRQREWESCCIVHRKSR